MLKRYDWEREYKGAHPRGNLSIPDYKVARAEERRKEIERQIDTMMTSFTHHVDEQINRLDESVDQVWQDTYEWNNIIRYLKTCPDDEYEALYERARKHLDALPQQERMHAKQALDEMIQQSKVKADNPKEKMNICKGKSKDEKEY